MLVLRRRVGEDLILDVAGEQVVVRMMDNQRLAVSASRAVSVHRGELYEKITGNKLPDVANSSRNDTKSPVKL